MVITASDTLNRIEYRPGTNFSISLSGDNELELTAYYQKLAEDGMVTVPLTKAMWGDTFGMVTDKFGVSWLVNISTAKEKSNSTGVKIIDFHQNQQ